MTARPRSWPRSRMPARPPGATPLVADAGLAGTAGDHDAAMAADGARGWPGWAAHRRSSPRGRRRRGRGGRLARDRRRPAALLDCTLTRLGAAELTGGDGPWWTAVLG